MNQSTIKKKSIKAAKYTIIYKPLGQLAGTLGTIFLVRALSESDFGIYNIFYSMISLLSMVASLGIGNTLQRFIPEYYSRGEFKIAHQLYKTASLIRLAINVVVLGLALMLWKYLGPLLKIEPYQKYFMLFTLVIIVHMQKGLLRTCLNAFFLQKYTQGFMLVFLVLKAIGYGIAIFYNSNLMLILLVDLIAYAVAFTLFQFVYNKKVNHLEGKLSLAEKVEWQRLLKYSLFYNFNDVGTGILNTNFDNFIIVSYLNPIAVGAYGFCQRITRMIGRFLPVAYFMEILQPAFFSLGTNADNKKVTYYFQLLFKMVFLFYIPVFIFFVICSKEIILILFDGKFIEYSNVLLVVLAFAMLNEIYIPVGLVAQLREKADVIFYSKIFAAYNVIADIILIKYIGLWGAVIATGTAVLGKNLFLWYFIRDLGRVKGLEKFTGFSIVWWGTIASLMLFIRPVIQNSYFLLGLTLFILLTFFILQFKFNLFTDSERRIISGFSRNRKLKWIIKLAGIAPAGN
ncbi:oligosaccharide flippase family protein [candidate division KSB1 bacterium]|nr:oligosaccharide flippase family protein [candidate division KSB1 bacterium]